MALTMKTLVALLIALSVSTIALAQDHPKSREGAEALVETMKFQRGKIVPQNGLATSNVPQGFRYLNGADANKVIVNLWGNPPGEQPLGLLMPDTSPLSRDAWAV